MLGDGKRREAAMLVVCAALGVIAILLLAIGIDTQSDALGTMFAKFGKALERPMVAPSAAATPFKAETPRAVPDAPEPPAPHGPVLGNSTTLITSDDYPVAALNKELQGIVGIELRIDAIGRVTDCVLTQSSGVAVLDEATCRLGRTRARFVPARTASGETIASTWRRRVVWRLPDNGECAHDPAGTCG